MRLDALRQRDQYQWFVKNSLGGGVTWNKRLSWRVYCLTNSPSQRSHWEMLFCSPLASNHHTQPRYLLPSAGRIGSISTWQNTTRRLIRLKAIFFLSFFFHQLYRSLEQLHKYLQLPEETGSSGTGTRCWGWAEPLSVVGVPASVCLNVGQVES